MTQEQLEQRVESITTWVNSVISNSKLTSELTDRTSITDATEKYVIQKGTEDAEAVTTSLLRGYKGTWDASSNTPVLVDGTGIDLDNYYVSVAGSQDFGNGSQAFNIGDMIKYADNKWIREGGASGSGGIPEAPIDGLQYGRINAAWTVITGGVPQTGASVKQFFTSQTQVIFVHNIGDIYPALQAYDENGFQIISYSVEAIDANTSRFTFNPSTSGVVVATIGGGTGAAGLVDSVNGQAGIVVLDTDDINEGSTNLYYTESRVTANTSVTANTAKIGITPTQASDIVINNAKISYTDAAAVALNTAKVGITPTQASDITTNNAKVSYNDAAIVSSHIGNVTTNPHQVTKTNLGLSNVPNIDCTNASNISTGTLPSSVLPPIALATVQVAASQVAMLALTTEEGDVVVRTDEGKTYMNNGGTAGTMADFTELQTPTDTVLSVNSQTGTVVLTTTNINEGTNLYYTEAKVTANTSVAANTAKVGITPSQITILSNTSGTNTGDQDLSGYLLNTTDTLTGNLTVTGAYVDSAGDPGVAGQVLSSTVTGTDWIDAGGAALSGTSIQRVAATSTPVGVSFWDTDLKIPCYLESTIWYNAAGGLVV